jgi:hypothetical protein
MHYEGMRMNGGVNPLILNLCIRQRLTVSFTGCLITILNYGPAHTFIWCGKLQQNLICKLVT